MEIFSCCKVWNFNLCWNISPLTFVAKGILTKFFFFFFFVWVKDRYEKNINKYSEL